MVVLIEQIEIPASYEKMEAWTANFEEEFVKWSPYHIECNLYNGNYHAGSKVRFREIVMGLDYDVTGTINGIGCSDPAVELAFLGADTFLLHCPDGCALMNGGKKLHALTLIASVVDTNVKPLFRKLAIA